MHQRKYRSVYLGAGFTLIELSIVLVIIGLIVGGVLVGRDLIKAAEIRAQISQIEKYNTAVRTFQGKYGDLPGDITADKVTQFGFTVTPSRAGIRGRGDGNGLIESYLYTTSISQGWGATGEAGWFWEDLSSNSGLIEGQYNYVTDANLSNNLTNGTYNISLVFPKAKIDANYVSIFALNNSNYFSLSAITQVSITGGIYNYALPPGLSVAQAQAIDSKVDDGLPQSRKSDSDVRKCSCS